MTRSILTIAAAALLLAGCTSKEPGDPTAGATTSTTATKSPDKTTTTSKPASGDALADFDACAQVNAVASQLSLSRIEPSGKDECDARWGQTTTAVKVKAFPDLGISDATGGSKARISDTSIGTRKAKKVEAGVTDTSCLIAVEVGSKSRVDFYAASTTSVQESCDAATKLATAIEPKLPK
ncbi:DUF3558 domain-containing protein [Saccharothrix variisporea]|uniref:DUF3558 domain-containing protein n=1 Tax=Saccharothrix variisporea TaxID=543527 RepID=A0A495XBK3_9PSEU|nr:hypothetical protein [Saccharothrix variisporea]RKT71861.1 hypothetical protein DFJ66_5158 [Saccharothrix variisporea]